MEGLPFDEIAKLTQLEFDQVIFLVDNRVIEVQKDETDVRFTENSLKTLKLIEKLLDLDYTLDNAAKIVKNVGEPVKPDEQMDEKWRKKRNLYTPGELAKLFDVSPRAVKYWEEKKLITPYTRSKTGIRFYHKKSIINIMLLKGFQNLGFSLDQIKVYLDLYDFVLSSNHKEKDLTKAKSYVKNLDDLDTKLDEYQSSISTLRRLSEKGRQKLKVILQKPGKDE